SPAVTVAVECREKDARVEMTADSLIYSFMLNYNPDNLDPVLWTSGAAIVVECHYPRNHNVSSPPLDPHWIPFAATKISSELLYFDMVLKTDDWLYERPVYQYFLGDMINIEVTVRQYLHTPLRVFVESCMATAEPDLNSNPRYNFIDNYGCLVDAKLTGSSSKFMPRPAEHTLQFQLEAFRFQASTSGLVDGSERCERSVWFLRRRWQRKHRQQRRRLQSKQKDPRRTKGRSLRE
ncbi:LOW QUALITY PROTEIN: hypothetical protein CRUP_002647, partial [Coryphaenoides rupestris]